MSYTYREVKCPWCDHIFMWDKNTTHEWAGILEYRIKETGEQVGKTKCPKCGMDMVVLNHVLDGIAPDDDRIEPIGIRGI